MSPLPPALNTPPATAEQRRQVALAVAAQCRELLQREFGATEVIVFGSLRGDTPWHQGSDLDLAVQGIPSPQLWDAYARLEAIAPGWLSVDLVALEQADERIRDRILQLTPMPQNLYLDLQLRLEDELVLVEKTIGQLNQALAQVDRVDELFMTPTLAAFVEDFYTGCEKLAERVAVTLDGKLPQGENWHEELQRQMAVPGGHERPPLWTAAVLAELDTYRRFRHRARHLYRFSLDGERVLALAQQVPEVFAQVQTAVGSLGEWLAQQALRTDS